MSVDEVLIENFLLIEKALKFNEVLAKLKEEYKDLKPVKDSKYTRFPYNNSFFTQEVNSEIFDRACITYRYGISDNEPALVDLYKVVPYYVDNINDYEFPLYIEIYGDPVHFELGVFRGYRVVPHLDWKKRATSLGYLHTTVDLIEEALKSEEESWED